MNIYVYSDESGVFDVNHNKFYVFGGLVFLSKEENDNESRKYIAVENTIRRIENKSKFEEIKATSVTNKSKSKLYRSLNHCEKFGVIINQDNVHTEIFLNKKHKQRYLDFAYKIAIKRKFEEMILKNQIKAEEVENINFFVDEHTTATDGLYELRESLLQEFKEGMFSTNYVKFYPPIFPNLKTLNVNYCNSNKKTLVRAADIISNKLYHSTITNNLDNINQENFKIIKLP